MKMDVRALLQSKHVACYWNGLTPVNIFKYLIIS